ncbi:tetratricopeptide repeat protein [Candidatus Sumerlaeota bacterium]|nr:tetratricopeptide repeat protein [Candidatus Sumerlaeota bacterium]
MNTSEKKFLLYLILGAMLIRMAYLYQMSSSPYFGSPFLDELYHLNWAKDIASGKWLGDDAFFRAPLYSYLLGIFIRIFGVHFYLIRLVQHLIGVIAVAAIYFLTRRIFSVSEAGIAGIIAACYAPFIFFEGEMLDIFLQFIFYPLILIQALKTLSMQSLKNNLLLGLLIGLSAIARPNILLFFPVLVVFFGIRWRKNRDSLFDILFRIMFIVIGMIVPVLPVTWHNFRAGGCFVPISTYGGVNFYIGNNPRADGYTARTARRMYYFGRYRDSVEMFAREEAILKTGKADLNAREISQYWFKQSLSWIRGNPVPWAKLFLKKSALLFQNYEIKNNKNIYFVTRYSSLLRFFLSFLPFALVGGLGMVGLAIALVQKRDSGVVLLLLFITTYTLGCALFFISSRYRAPLVAMLAPFAGFALTSLWRASGEKRHVFLSSGMAGLTVFMIFSFVDWFHIRPKNFSADHFSVGNCFQEKNNLNMALRHFQQAWELEPNYAEAQNNVGEVLFNQGDYGAALAVFKDLARKHPDYASGLNNLGVVYEKVMMYPQAEEWYRRALEVHPGHIRARVNLAETLLKQGREEEAKKEFEKINWGQSGK